MNKNTTSKKYSNIKLTLSITKGILSFSLLLWIILSGFSENLELIIRYFIKNDYLVFLTFVLLLGFFSSILFFPLNYYSGFYLEHKYNLSNQTFLKWVLENTKGLLVGLLIGIPILMMFFWILNTFGNLWWLPLTASMFIISVVLAQLVPVLILPLFYKVIPLENEELKERITELGIKAGLKIENVFKFDMSKNTKKANAAFTGLGRTKRILLGDTLLDNYTHDEIETVIAHEMGHYKHKHIIKNLIIGTISSFLTFWLMAYLYDISLIWFGFISIYQISALPILALWGTVIGLVQTPITNLISRKFEYEADSYAVNTTDKREAFISTLTKLNEQNLGDKEPHPFVEWYFYSHPSVKKRINFIMEL